MDTLHQTNRPTNPLINEKSPYLLQHAYNPVNWYPWSEEAFVKAKTEDKPIFLSIGYSTCHWCHVMERESFEDEAVSAILNEKFISIKVDREERPDVDHIYMSVCQAMTGSGGWPLTIIMTPDRKPFFAGTYFPKETKYGRAGIMTILNNIHDAWTDKRDEILESGDKILEAIEESVMVVKKGTLRSDILESAYKGFNHTFDSKHGGFGAAPKFPTPHNLTFLLRYWHQTKEQKALFMVEKTLDSMFRGGIYDHIGFGFSRYSTDDEWLVPHFEKMLYDNALLTFVYLETYQISKNEKYPLVAKELLTYVLRDMTSPEGAFYSAEDADSEGVEGKFYVWDYQEVIKILGEEEGTAFCKNYDITPRGNFEGKSIPNLIYSDIERMTERIRQKLFNYREQRIHPYKDDKVLTSWNGLMIAAMAKASRVLNEVFYAHAAERAVNFIWQKLRRDDGRLLARYRDGDAAFLAYVDDYAFLIWGLIELYEATFNPNHLAKALELNNDLIELFWDDKDGGLYIYGKDGEELIARPKEIYDGATPSGNSVATMNWLRLARITGDQELENRALQQFSTFGGNINSNPLAYTQSLSAYSFTTGPTKEVVLVGDLKDKVMQNMLSLLKEEFNPNITVIVKTTGEEGEALVKLVPYLKDYNTIDGKTAAYVCENFSCQAPVTNADELKLLISKSKVTH